MILGKSGTVLEQGRHLVVGELSDDRVLEGVLVELCRIILRLGNSAMNMGLKEDVEISIDFDDSIIEDEESDFNRDSRMLQMGILNDWEFRMKWMNEDEKTAKEALPQMASLVSDA